MTAKMSNNYKSCPLKKRPIIYLNEDEPEVSSKFFEVSSRPFGCQVEEDQPQDLSLKRKASDGFEDCSLPAKRDFILNLSTSAPRQAAVAEPCYRPESPAISVASEHSRTSSVMLSPKAERDSHLEYQPTDIHLRGLTPDTAGYTTNPYRSAFVMAAGCNPMSALWHQYQGFNSTGIFPSPASTISSPNFYANSTNASMLMTPPSSPGSDASSSSEPEDLSVRNDIPLPALYHLFDEAPKLSASSASANSSYYSASSTAMCDDSSATALATKHYRFRCDKCSKMYSTSMGLSKHQQFHCPAAECNQEKRQHSCQDCGKLYTTIGALKMHIRTHTLPCKCPICGKAFSRPWLLQGHIRTHTGEKPFQCPDCPRSFADRSNLRAHQQTHVDIKKYACKVCHKSFSRMSLLNKHASSNCTITIA